MRHSAMRAPSSTLGPAPAPASRRTETSRPSSRRPPCVSGARYTFRQRLMRAPGSYRSRMRASMPRWPRSPCISGGISVADLRRCGGSPVDQWPSSPAILTACGRTGCMSTRLRSSTQKRRAIHRCLCWPRGSGARRVRTPVRPRRRAGAFGRCFSPVIGERLSRLCGYPSAYDVPGEQATCAGLWPSGRF